MHKDNIGNPTSTRSDLFAAMPSESERSLALISYRHTLTFSYVTDIKYKMYRSISLAFVTLSLSQVCPTAPVDEERQ